MSIPLADERYVSLETVRKNGTKAETPVWVTELDGALVVITDADSWKVKRIRRNPNVRLAPCSQYCLGAYSSRSKATTSPRSRTPSRPSTPGRPGPSVCWRRRRAEPGSDS